MALSKQHIQGCKPRRKSKRTAHLQRLLPSNRLLTAASRTSSLSDGRSIRGSVPLFRIPFVPSCLPLSLHRYQIRSSVYHISLCPERKPSPPTFLVPVAVAAVRTARHAWSPTRLDDSLTAATTLLRRQGYGPLHRPRTYTRVLSIMRWLKNLESGKSDSTVIRHITSIAVGTARRYITAGAHVIETWQSTTKLQSNHIKTRQPHLVVIVFQRGFKLRSTPLRSIL